MYLFSSLLLKGAEGDIFFSRPPPLRFVRRSVCPRAHLSFRPFFPIALAPSFFSERDLACHPISSAFHPLITSTLPVDDAACTTPVAPDVDAAAHTSAHRAASIVLGIPALDAAAAGRRRRCAAPLPPIRAGRRRCCPRTPDIDGAAAGRRRQVHYS